MNQIIDDAKQTFELAERSDKQRGYLSRSSIYRPRAPYWDPDCRGAIFGITRDTEGKIGDILRRSVIKREIS